MRRILITLATTAMLAGPTGAASAQPANAGASCVAVITSYEASQLDPGFVGHEVSGLATSGPGLGQALVSPLARTHLGSIAACREAEG